MILRFPTHEHRYLRVLLPLPHLDEQRVPSPCTQRRAPLLLLPVQPDVHDGSIPPTYIHRKLSVSRTNHRVLIKLHVLSV